MRDAQSEPRRAPLYWGPVKLVSRINDGTRQRDGSTPGVTPGRSVGGFRRSDAALVLVVGAIFFGLWTLRAQVTDVQQLNDNSIHASMVRWAEARIRSGHMP